MAASSDVGTTANASNADVDSAAPSSKDMHLKLLKAGQLHWMHWVIVSLSLVLTLGAWQFSREQMAQKIDERFQREAENAITLIQDRMMLYANALQGGVAFLDSNQGEISFQQWADYAGSLNIDKAYPGINGIGVIYNVSQDELSNFVAAQQTYNPGFELHPATAGGDHWPITLIEPIAPNIQAIGLDMAFEANRYDGVLRARDTGQAQLTGPITLVQDSEQTPGFLLYVPFYQSGSKPESVTLRRETIIGVTYAPFIMQKLMLGTLAPEYRQVGIDIRDGDETLYNESDLNQKFTPRPALSRSIKVPLYGRQWTLDIWANAALLNSFSENQPAFILGGGILIDALLLSLFIFLTRANRRALAYADERTTELKEKSKRLEISNRELDQFAYVASHDLKAPLRGISQLASWIGEDLAEKKDTTEHLRLMKNRVGRMRNLLDDLLAYSKIGKESQQIQEIDTRAVLQRVFEMTSTGGNFQLKFQGSFPTFKTAFVSFELVFRNLLSNAFKHHDGDKGTITLAAKETQESYFFTVTDDGPGIPQEFHEKIFGFYQTLRPRDEVEGSGMGLAIIKKHLDTHGGKITLISSKGEGASFCVEWPKTIAPTISSLGQ